MESPQASWRHHRSAGSMGEPSSRWVRRVKEWFSPWEPYTGRRNYFFDLLHMTTGFFLVYTAFSAIQNLESSLNNSADSGLGSVSLAVLYLVLTFSCFVAPLVVAWVGSKFAMVLAFVTQCLFVAANISPSWYTLPLASGLLGFGASFLWAGEGSYLTWCAIRYARSRGEDEKSTQGFFNGVFFGIFQLTQVIGNLLSSLVLGQSPSTKTQTTLFVVFLCTAVAGTVVSFFLRPQRNQDDDYDSISTSHKGSDSGALDPEHEGRPNIKEKLLATLRLMIQPKMLLLLPIIYYCGLEQAFAWGDFTSQVIVPALGKSNIGFVMACFGAADALGSVVSGKLSDRFGRLPLIYLGALMQLAVSITLAVYTPPQDKFGPLIGMAILWGFGDGIWNTLLNAMLGSMFTRDAPAAFSNLKLFQSAAVSAAFFYGSHPSVTLGVKLAIVVGVLVFGMICLTFAAFLFTGVNKAPAVPDNEDEETIQ